MRLTAALPVLALLSACGGGGDAGKAKTDAAAASGEPKRSVSSELPKGVKPSASVMEARKIAGVWRSSPGALSEAPKQLVQLEIAFDNSFTMTLWGKDPKASGEAVFARQSGRIGRTSTGIAGSTSGAKPSGLARLASWSAAFDRDGLLILSPSGGGSVPLRRTGN
jgi:hypothetical protein